MDALNAFRAESKSETGLKLSTNINKSSYQPIKILTNMNIKSQLLDAKATKTNSQPVKFSVEIFKWDINCKTSQELRMLSSVTINCEVTKIGMNSGSQLSEL